MKTHISNKKFKYMMNIFFLIWTFHVHFTREGVGKSSFIVNLDCWFSKFLMY